MKILIYIFYFIRSILLRGPINSIQILRFEKKYESLFGIKSTGLIPSKNPEYFHYQGAPYAILLKILNAESKFTKNFQFVDIGSGMGRAVFAAEYCGYSNLLGIELNPDLVKLANQNKQLYQLKRKDSHIQFIYENALQYSYEDQNCVYFLFNPFNAVVLKAVVKRIISVTQRPSFFIYMNPIHADVFNELKIEKVRTYTSAFYNEAFVYKIGA